MKRYQAQCSNEGIISSFCTHTHTHTRTDRNPSTINEFDFFIYTLSLQTSSNTRNNQSPI